MNDSFIITHTKILSRFFSLPSFLYKFFRISFLTYISRTFLVVLMIIRTLLRTHTARGIRNQNFLESPHTLLLSGTNTENTRDTDHKESRHWHWIIRKKSYFRFLVIIFLCLFPSLRLFWMKKRKWVTYFFYELLFRHTISRDNMCWRRSMARSTKVIDWVVEKNGND